MAQENIEQLHTLLSDPNNLERTELLDPVLEAFSQNQVPFIAFIGFLVSVKERQWIEFLSSVLDTYVPSYRVLPLEKRDVAWTFLQVLSPEHRSQDLLFFTSIWKACQEKKVPLLSPISEVILLSILKHSGLYQINMLEFHLYEFQQLYGYLPFELLVTYEEEDTDFFPIPMVYRWMMISMVFFGQHATAELLSTLTEKHEDQDYFDLETLWLNYSDFFTTCTALSVGEIILKTQELASKKQVVLPPLSTFPQYMIYQVHQFQNPDQDRDSSQEEDPFENWYLG